jgi:hypothetical protein
MRFNNLEGEHVQGLITQSQDLSLIGPAERGRRRIPRIVNSTVPARRVIVEVIPQGDLGKVRMILK